MNSRMTLLLLISLECGIVVYLRLALPASFFYPFNHQAYCNTLYLHDVSISPFLSFIKF